MPGRRKVDDETLPNWNLHPNDVRNLTEFISGLPRWPKLLTYQEVDLEKVLAQGSVRDLLQAPILYLSGLDEPKFTDAQVQLLRSYVEQGGFIFAVNNCNGSGFDDGIRSLAARLYASGDAQLKRLPPEHPIYRAEYSARSGRDRAVGGRLRLPDVVCLFPAGPFLPVGQVVVQPVPKRHAAVQRAGAALDATWGSTWWPTPPGANRTTSSTPRRRRRRQRNAGQDRTRSAASRQAAAHGRLGRGAAGLAERAGGAQPDSPACWPRRVSGTWCPAIENLSALSAGLSARPLEPSSSARRRSKSSASIWTAGAVLFADACCGSPQFDQSFREMVRQLYPDKKLERIPITHELFSQGVGIRHPQGEAADPGRAAT